MGNNQKMVKFSYNNGHFHTTTSTSYDIVKKKNYYD